MDREKYKENASSGKPSARPLKQSDKIHDDPSPIDPAIT